MENFTIKRYLHRIMLLFFLLFVCNKFLLRPWILDSDSPSIFKITVLSLPNFIEAVMGTILLTGILTFLQYRIYLFTSLKTNTLYGIAVSLAGIYVVLQEFKIHNLGGRNIYDPYDVLASLLGLITIFFILKRKGFVEKRG